MPYKRPTLIELRDQIVADMQSGNLPALLNVMFKSVLWVFANVWAGIAHLFYNFLAYIARQSVPWTATDKYLEAWAGLKGIYRKSASESAGQVTFSCNSGMLLPAKTQIVLTGGLQVETLDEAKEAEGKLTAPARSLGTGIDQNAPVGTSCTLASPIAGISMTGTVTEAFTGGSDIETDDNLRDRMLLAYQEGGDNGAEKDYIKWAKEDPAVTRAWCYRGSFMDGTAVMVLFMCDKTNADNGGYPQGSDGSATLETRYKTAAGDQLRIADLIYPKRPVTALVICGAPQKQPVDFVIENLGDADTTENQAKIIAVLKDMFMRKSEPGKTIYPSDWLQAIAALNLSHFTVSSPVLPIRAEGKASMPDLGNVSFLS